MAKTYTMFIACAIAIAACNDSSNVATNENKSDTTGKTFDMSTARKTIDESNEKFAEAFKKGDSTAVASFYSSDARVMPSNNESVKKDGIAGFWGSAMRMGIKELKVNTTDLEGNAELLAETGKYELLDSNGKSLDKGKYVVVWKNENGQWKIYRDIWNTNNTAK